MGLLDFLFGKKLTIEDPFFGSMIFDSNKKDSSKSFFRCNRHFMPKNGLIEVGVEASESGPTASQIDFFKSIEDNYLLIADSMNSTIEQELGDWLEGFDKSEFDKQFVPIYLSIPRCETRPFVWEISFESKHDLNHIFTLLMTDFEATDLQVDG